MCIRDSLSRVGMDFLDDKKTLEDLIREEKFAQAAYTYEKRWSLSLIHIFGR